MPPLGAMWAQNGRQERFKSLLVAARWRRKVDRFQLPGGGPGAPRSLPESLPESIIEATFLGAPLGTNKA